MCVNVYVDKPSEPAGGLHAAGNVTTRGAAITGDILRRCLISKRSSVSGILQVCMLNRRLK